MKTPRQMHNEKKPTIKRSQERLGAIRTSSKSFEGRTFKKCQDAIYLLLRIVSSIICLFDISPILLCFLDLQRHILVQMLTNLFSSEITLVASHFSSGPDRGCKNCVKQVKGLCYLTASFTYELSPLYSTAQLMIFTKHPDL